jgi:hypothetical protein
VSLRTRRATPEETREIASRAAQLRCDNCGAPPGEPCTHPGRGRSVCKSRFVAGAIAIRREAKAARRSPEQEAELAAVLARLPRLTREEVEAGRSPRGGFTRAQLAEWSVPWPPPSGWLQTLLRGEDGSDDS